MQRQILNRWTNAVLWSGEAETVKDAIHAALEVIHPDIRAAADRKFTAANLEMKRTSAL